MPSSGQFLGGIFLAFACWGIGNFAISLFLAPFLRLNTAYIHILCFSAGNILLSYILTILGFLGFFTPSIFWVIFFISLGLAIFQVTNCLFAQKFTCLQGQLVNPLPIKNNHYKMLLLLSPILLIVLFQIPAIMQSLAPPYMRDSLVYHLLCPKEYLKAGQLLHINGNLYSAFPKGQEVILTFLLALAGDRAAQGFSIGQNIAAIICLFLIIRLVTNSSAALICTLGYATVPPAIYFSGCGYVEPALLMTFAASLLALFFFFNKKAENNKSAKLSIRESALIGFIAGWMPALKYTGIIYWALIGLLILWTQKKEPATETLKELGFYTLAAVPGFCWLIWNWIKLGNPVYPFAYGLFSGIGWDEVRDRAMYLYFQMFGMGKEVWDYFLLPWRFSFLGRFDSLSFDGAMGPFLLIFIILAIFSAIKRLPQLPQYKILNGVGIILLISAALFVLGSQQARFWLPSQLLLCIYAAPATDRINSWVNKKSLAKFLFSLLISLSLIWNAWFLGKQIISIGYYKPVLAIEKEESFLKRVVPGYSAMEFINKNLAQNSRIFCIWTGAYGYYMNVPYYSDTLIEDITLKKFIDEAKDWQTLNKRLTEKGFSHIFVRISLTANNMTSNQFAIFKDFLLNGTKEIYREEDFAVFKILTFHPGP